MRINMIEFTKKDEGKQYISIILFELPESSNEEKRFNCSYQDIVIAVKEVTPFAETRIIKIENGIRINIFDIPHLN